MIYALVRDQPWKDCARRKVAIVVDKSDSNAVTDPTDLRIAATRDLALHLVGAVEADDGTLPALVAVVGFDGDDRSAPIHLLCRVPR